MDASANVRAHRRILLLQQDEYIASLLDMLLHREGFEITALTCDDNARSYIKGGSPPDLIFIDNSWIINDRIEVLSELNRRIEWQRVPMILLMSFTPARCVSHLPPITCVSSAQNAWVCAAHTTGWTAKPPSASTRPDPTSRSS